RLRDALILSVAHGLAADTAEKRNKWLGVPVVVLTSIVGTSVFASLSDLGKSQISIAIATGILSIMAAVFAAVQTFLNFAGSAQAHGRASVRFQALGSMIELLLIQPMRTSRRSWRR